MITVVVLLTPTAQFFLLSDVALLPMAFLRQAFLMQAFPTGLFLEMSGVSGFPVIPAILVMAAGILAGSGLGQINVAAELQQPN